MLERYRENQRIMHIGGSNFQFGRNRGDGDYYYSTLSHVWGWATWRRAWNKYEYDLKTVNAISDQEYQLVFNHNQIFISCYQDIFKKVSNAEIDTWDYQWFYAIILNNGLTICPNVNLVQNIGFGKHGTHTLQETNWNKLNTAKIIYTFNRPSKIVIDYEADEYTLREIMGIKEKVISKNKNVMNIIKRKISFLKKTNLYLKVRSPLEKYYMMIKKLPGKINFLRKTDHQKVFTKIYSENLWGVPGADKPFYSGTGSDDEYTESYSSVVSNFILNNHVKSMIDLGCGDFRVGKKILEKTNIEYTGVDVVPQLITYNQNHYANTDINFKCLNIVTDALPEAEFCTIRQVLQHLSNSDIKKVLQKCTKYKYLIVTEHLPGTESLNPNVDKQSDENIRLNYNSGVYLDKPPYSFKVKELLTVHPEAEKGSKVVTFQVWLNA